MERNLIWTIVCLVVALWTPLSAAGQRYDYQVTYRGVFSLGQDMPIADLMLEASAASSGSELVETRLEASSEAYPAVESLYPIRYRFRSWAAAENSHLVGFEAFERTGKLRHRLYLRDDSGLGMRRFELQKGVGQVELAGLSAGKRPPAVDLTRQLYDRLGLLQTIRATPLREKAEFRLPVTNGRDQMLYRVKVEGRAVLKLAEQSYPAWKLRFDADEMEADGSVRPAHRPVFIWLSQDEAQIPLRADARHAVGLFRVEWKPPSGGRHQLAQSAH